MNLPQDLSLKIVEYLPKHVQYVLIDDTPVGRHCCNQVFQYIKIGHWMSDNFFEVEFHPAVYRLRTIQVDCGSYRVETDCAAVSSFGLLKARYPYYLPDQISFRSLTDVVQFYSEYGQDIHKFRAIDIYGSVLAADLTMDDVPSLTNVRHLSLKAVGAPDGAQGLSELDVQAKFGRFESLSCPSVNCDLAVFPNLKTVKTAHLQDFSSLHLQSLSITRECEFDPAYVPRSVSDLVLPRRISGNVDLRALQLTSLEVTLPIDDLPGRLFDLSCPSLRYLKLAASFEEDPDVGRDMDTALFPKLTQLKVADIPVDFLHCIVAPNLRSLSLDHVRGVVPPLRYKRIVYLALEDVLLEEGFQVPPLVSSVYMRSVRTRISHPIPEASGLHQGDPSRKHTKPAVDSFDDPHFPVNDFTKFQTSIRHPSLFEFNSEIKELNIMLEQDSFEVQEFFDSLPKDLLSLTVETLFPIILKPGQQLDLQRFESLVSLGLFGMEFGNDDIVFPTQLIFLDLRVSQFTSLPNTPSLEVLNMTFSMVPFKQLEVPANLRSLNIGGFTSDQTIELDLTSSSLEYLMIYEAMDIAYLKLPSTMKALTFSSVDGDYKKVDSSLCSGLYRFFTL